MSISQKGEGNMLLASSQKELHVLCYAVVQWVSVGLGSRIYCSLGLQCTVTCVGRSVNCSCLIMVQLPVSNDCCGFNNTHQVSDVVADFLNSTRYIHGHTWTYMRCQHCQFNNGILYKCSLIRLIKKISPIQRQYQKIYIKTTSKKLERKN